MGDEEFPHEEPMREIPPKLLEKDGGVRFAFGESRRKVTTRTFQQFRDPDRDEETARGGLVTHHLAMEGCCGTLRGGSDELVARGVAGGMGKDRGAKKTQY